MATRLHQCMASSLGFPALANPFRRPMRVAHGSAADILKPDVNLVVLRHQHFQLPALQLVISTLPEFTRKVVARRTELPEAAGQLVEPLPTNELRSALQKQLEGIAEEYCDVLGYDSVAATLECIKETRCMRFHTDHVDVRCLCTVAGAGTQWVEDADVDRTRLSRLPEGDKVGMSAVRSALAVHQAAAGDVLFLKGNTFPGASGRGIVHRSPDAVDERRPRLLLKLDPPPCSCTDPGCQAGT